VTPAETAEALAIVTLIRPEFQVSRGTVKIWHRLFVNTSAEDFTNALQQHFLTSKFAPMPADINEILSAPEHPSVSEAWSEVRRTIHKVGYYNKPEFSDTAIANVVQSIGWQVLCDMTNPDTTRAHFMKLYEAETRSTTKRAMLNTKPELPAEVSEHVKALAESFNTETD
jgi:O-methyltransferase involved in polyketide biosynthesis